MLPKLDASQSPHGRPPLRSSERKAQLQLKLRQQARFRTSILLFIIVFIWIMDATFLTAKPNTELLITKSAALGAGLNWLSQTLFTWFVFRFSGGRAGRDIVNQLYAGQLVKWLIMLVGFSAVFLMMKPLSTGALFTGFLIMQLGHFIVLWRFR